MAFGAKNSGECQETTVCISPLTAKSAKPRGEGDGPFVDLCKKSMPLGTPLALMGCHKRALVVHLSVIIPPDERKKKPTVGCNHGVGEYIYTLPHGGFYERLREKISREAGKNEPFL